MHDKPHSQIPGACLGEGARAVIRKAMTATWMTGISRRIYELDQDLMRLITRLIDSRTGDWSPDMVQDRVQENLLEIIDAKQKGANREFGKIRA